jgi:hypothetical protein
MLFVMMPGLTAGISKLAFTMGMPAARAAGHPATARAAAMASWIELWKIVVAFV